MPAAGYSSPSAKAATKARAYAHPRAWEVPVKDRSSGRAAPFREVTNAPPRHDPPTHKMPPRLMVTRIDQLPTFSPEEKVLLKEFVKAQPEYATPLLYGLEQPEPFCPSICPRTGQVSQYPNDKFTIDFVCALHQYYKYMNGLDLQPTWAPLQARFRHLGELIRDYILTPTEMAQNGYPIPSYLRDQVEPLTELGPYVHEPRVDHTWVESKWAEEERTFNSRSVLGIDCEMVRCGKEQVLAQVSVVDFFSDQIIYFRYVSPPEGQVITDYVTDKSGITPAILSGPTSTLIEVQADLLRIIDDSNTILIGHGLQTDLQVLKMMHSKVADTSLLYDGPATNSTFSAWWRRSKLKDLARRYLSRDNFQCGSHNPADDAQVACQLVKLKCDNGPTYGGGGYRQWKERRDRAGAIAESIWAPQHSVSGWAQSHFQTAPESFFVPSRTSRAARITPPTVPAAAALPLPESLSRNPSGSDMDLDSGSEDDDDDDRIITPGASSPAHTTISDDDNDITLCDDGNDTEPEADCNEITNKSKSLSFVSNASHYLGGLGRTTSLGRI